MRDSELQKHMNPSLYRILCCDKNASDETIKKNWKGLQRTHHPDKNIGNEDFAKEESQKINFAYQVLSNATYRARYDTFYDKYLVDEAANKRKAQELKIRTELKLVKEKLSSETKTYLIGYDLKTPGDYIELNEVIKHFVTWWHHLDSTWIIRTALDTKEIRNKLTPHIKKGDKLLVVLLGGAGAWRGFPESGSTWLKKHL